MDDRPHVYELVAETLARLGHRTLFGLLGSGNFKFADHFVRACEGRHVWVRHEAAGVVAADTYAQATRGLGLATAHQGPGFTNTLTALSHSVRERTPLLLVVGETARGRKVNQTMDVDGVARALGAGVERVRTATAVADVARAAARAQRERIPVVLPLPIDLQEERGERSEPEPTGAFNAPRTRPAPADVAAAADLIERSERPLILGGRGAVLAGARGSLEALGEGIGALYATSLRGNGLFAGNPRSLGVCGGFATKRTERVVPEADLVLAFGASLNQWTTMHGTLLGDTAVVQCDADASAIGAHRDVRLALAGDAGEAADALLEELGRRGHAAADGWGELEPYDASDEFDEQPGDGTIDPRQLVVELDRALPPERVVTYDGGHFHWFPTAYLGVPNADSFVAAQGFQSVGLGLGSAIGLATAHPGRPALVLCGDGGTMMSLGELDALTAQRLPVLVAIFNDAAYGAEVHHFGPMGLPTGLVEFGDRDFAAVAGALGARSATVRAPGDVAGPVAAWLGELDGPLVLDCKVNPAVVAERLAEAFKGGA
jgi:thiamine pyrophosphate-dependent acetolactate synthase large subunit-like protein